MDDRYAGKFDHTEDGISAEERAEITAGYKSAAGFAMEALNAAPQTIRDGAKIK